MAGHHIHFVIDLDCPYYPNCGYSDIYSTVFLSRLRADGTRDPNFAGANPDASVRVLLCQSDGKVLVGGSFTGVNGAARNGLARLNPNGGLDESFNPGSGSNRTVYAIALQPDGKVLMGGFFGGGSATNHTGIARLNTDGTLDPAFNSPILSGRLGYPWQWQFDSYPVVRAIALQTDGNVLIGGDFASVNGLMRPRMARLYGDPAAPLLSLSMSGNLAVLSWPVAFGNFQLKENTNVSLTNGWSAVGGMRSTNNGMIFVSVPTSAASKFFRLSSP